MYCKLMFIYYKPVRGLQVTTSKQSVRCSSCYCSDAYNLRYSRTSLNSYPFHFGGFSYWTGVMGWKGILNLLRRPFVVTACTKCWAMQVPGQTTKHRLSLSTVSDMLPPLFPKFAQMSDRKLRSQYESRDDHLT